MPDARVVPPSRVSLIWVAFRRGLGSLGGPFGGTLLLLGAQICLLVATLSLAAIAVRALPWMLDPKVGWGAIAVFAKGLIVVALETSLMIGLPLAAALVASSVSDRGESVACVLVGASPMRLAALCIPSSLALSIAPLVLSIAWGDVRPGVALASMIASARDACSAIDRPVSEVPMTGAAWLCAPGQPPVLALASHSVVRATSVSIADDLRTVAASGVRIDTVIPTSADIVDNPVDVVPDAEPLTSLLQLEHGVPAIHLEVREAVFRGLPTIARPRSLPAVVRAWLVSASAVIGAWSVMTVLLSRLDARRWMAVALGAATSAITLLVLALVERRAPMLAPLVLAAPLIPPAIVVCTTRIRAAFENRS